MNPSRFRYPNARRPQTGERPMGFIGLGRLRDWARLQNDPSQLIAWMLSNIPELEKFLNSGSIDNYSLELLMMSLKSVLQVSNYDQSLTKLLTILATTRFYDHVITFLRHHNNINGKGEAETCLHFIIETIRKAPTLTENCLEILKFIYNNYQKLRCDEELLQNALEMFTTSGQIKAKKERRHLRKWRDDDEPPDDIRDVSIFPTSRDLNTDFTPFLRANKTTGAYRDVDHYFDVMFRLMREDFIQPLREGIGKYQINGAAPEDSDMLFYENVKIIGLEVFNGIDHILMLDMSKLQKVRWDSDRRLIFGSLICLTNNNFKTIIYATVTQMDRSEIKKGILRVRFQNCLEDVYGFSSEEALTLTENPSFFEAYRHVLEGLQEMVEKRLPMEQYLVRCEKEIDAPAYLKRQTQYNLSCIVKTRRISSTVQVIKTENWPDLAYVCLNEHQYMAVKAALTKELTLLQGPPGTGKTFVGLKVMRSLLENLANTSAAGSPILVVCYTNHALDQFLEEMLPFCGDGIVRVGGKNDSVKLKQFNLKELRSKQRDSRSTINCIRDCHREMDEIGKKIKALADKIQISHLSIISEKSLQRCMSLRHSHQFNQTSGKSIRHWLCASELELENHIQLVVEAHLVKLFLSETTSLNDTHLNFRYIIPVEQRKKVYRFWLKRYEKKTGILNSTSLISERELKEYVNPEVYQKIIRHYGNLKAWLLGSNVNEMVAAIEEIQRNWQHNQLFDDSEEYNRIREQRQFDDESDDEDDRKQAPRSRVVRSQTSLLQKCHLLGIDITSDVTQEVSHREAWQEVQKKLTFSQVIRLLRVSKPMTTKEENSVVNIWTLSLSEKYRLYKCWLLKYHSSLNAELKALVEEYESVLKIKLEQREMQDVNILKQSKVIGMTTTGAAKHRKVLQKIGPKIVVVEEAAEVLEAHIVTALSEHCQHLILIGDHQQLRPKTEVYQLAKKFGLEISLFERLVKNNISCVQLTEQHRMRPEISKYMKHIYPALKDSSSVHGRDHVMGMHKDIFFINHDRHEGVIQNSRSKLNEYEAKYLLKLALYLVIQGYSAGEITILATYGGQVNLIKECLANMRTHRLQGIRVSTVDNFQGEQNKIILLSLVRSNTQGSVGFLSTDNRICVALSRAQYGMYVIGNIDLLSQHSSLWSKIQATAQSHSELGQVLRLCCKHHQRVTLVKDASDFDLVKAGGCGQACKLPLSCGHICTYLCHAVSHDTLPCKEPCEKKCPKGHACKGVCSKQCPPCSTEIEVKLKCNHILKVKCSLYSSASSYSCVEECQKFCLKGHKCKGKCSQSCPPCLEKLNCGHVCSNVPCCSVKPTYILGCHEKCQKECQNGHKCPAPCLAECPTSCDNTLRLCGHICGSKFNIVSSQHLLPIRFRKQTCSHQCPKLCAGGRHPCSGKCSEPCPPCQSVVRYRLTCGHIGVLECHKNLDTHKWHCKECHAKKMTFPCGHSIEVSDPPVKQCPYCLLDDKFTKLQI